MRAPVVVDHHHSFDSSWVSSTRSSFQRRSERCCFSTTTTTVRPSNDADRIVTTRKDTITRIQFDHIQQSWDMLQRKRKDGVTITTEDAREVIQRWAQFIATLLPNNNIADDERILQEQQFLLLSAMPMELVQACRPALLDSDCALQILQSFSQLLSYRQGLLETTTTSIQQPPPLYNTQSHILTFIRSLSSTTHSQDPSIRLGQFQLLISLFGATDLARIQNYWTATSSSSPTIPMYKLYFQLLGQLNHGDEIQKLKQQAMREGKFQTTLLESYIRAFIQAHKQNTDYAKICESLDSYPDRNNDDDPSTTVFHVVLRQAAALANIDLIQHIMDDVWKLSSESRAFLGVTTTLFNTLLQEGTQNPSGAKFCTMLLRMMETGVDQEERRVIAPDLDSYNIVLKEIAKNGEAETAENLLTDMLSSDLSPGAETGTSVVKAWSRSSVTAGVERVEALFRSMKANNIRPDGQTFASIFYAWSQTEFHPPAARRCIDLWREMLKLSIEPQESHYIYLMSAIVRNVPGEEKAYAICSKLLEDTSRCYKDVNGSGEVQRSLEVFFPVMELCERNGNASRAETLLAQIVAEYRGGNPRMRPNLQMYWRLLRTYMQSPKLQSQQNADAPERMREIIEEMKSLGDEKCDPELVSKSFTFLFYYYKNAGASLENTEAAEKLLNELENDPTINTNSSMYTVLMQMYSKSKIPSVIGRVEALSERFENHGFSRNDFHLFVLTAYSRNGEAQKALEYFNRLDRVNAHQVGAVANAFAEQGDIAFVERLFQMHGRALSSRMMENTRLKAILNCDSISAREKWEAGWSTYKSMKQTSPHTYGLILDLYLKICSPGDIHVANNYVVSDHQFLSLLQSIYENKSLDPPSIQILANKLLTIFTTCKETRRYVGAVPGKFLKRLTRKQRDSFQELLSAFKRDERLL